MRELGLFFRTRAPAWAREHEHSFVVFYELAAVGVVAEMPCDVI